MKRNASIIIVGLVSFVAVVLFVNNGDARKRRFIETRRIPELSLREAHLQDVLVYLQEELEAQLPENTPAFVIAPDLMIELASPVIVLDKHTITNLSNMLEWDFAVTNSGLPLVSLDCTNQNLLTILKLMESQGVFRVHGQGQFIVLTRYERISQPTPGVDSRPGPRGARTPQE